MKEFIFATVTLVFALAGHAAGFDCKKAVINVEKTICSQKQISVR